MPKNYTLDDILNEYSGEEKHKPPLRIKPPLKLKLKAMDRREKSRTRVILKYPPEVFRMKPLHTA